MIGGERNEIRGRTRRLELGPRPCENYPWAGMSDDTSGLTELLMSRFIEGQDRSQSVLFPEQLEDWISEDNPVRAVDVFVEALDLRELGFDGAQPADTGRPAYHPAT